MNYKSILTALGALGLGCALASGQLVESLAFSAETDFPNNAAESNLVKFDGTLDFTYGGAGLGILEITINNLSDPGVMTAFGISFNQSKLAYVDGSFGATGEAGLAFLPPSYDSYGGNPGFNDTLFVTSAGNPAPQKGLQSGDSLTFTFHFVGIGGFDLDFGSFTADNFFTGNDTMWDMAFRVQQTGNGGDSNKLGWEYFREPGDNPVVPEPSTYGLMGAMGLAGLILWRRRRRAAVSR